MDLTSRFVEDSCAVRYIDTSSRDPNQALGAWLESELLPGVDVVELRWQSGFFTSDVLGYFVPVLKRLSATSGAVRILVGSNDGMTPRADIEALLDIAGPARSNQRIGLVSFRNAFFHSKTVHLRKTDGSAAGYVGSANLTGSGAASLHVEAGMLLDSRDGDSGGTLDEVQAAIDWWFETDRPGLSVVESKGELDALVEDGILNVPRPVPPTRHSGGEKGKTRSEDRLAPLLRLPKLPGEVKATAPLAGTPPEEPEAAFIATTATVEAPALEVEELHWGKELTASDAQRKQSGNQRGSITLVRPPKGETSGTYFREKLFGNQTWAGKHTQTGLPMEEAIVPFSVDFLGTPVGVLNLKISHAENRASGQNNYKTLLHLGNLTPYFAANDVSQRQLDVTRKASGQYTLSVH
jgi:hypothetical protein